MYAILDKIVIDKNGNIGIGTMMPICSFDASQKTDCIIIPSGYENEKPLIPYDGMLRVDKFEFSLQIYRGGWSNFGNIVPTILGVSQYNLVNVSTETIITGTNFEPSMEWEFIGVDGSREFPLVIYISSNQVILTRPDIFPTSNSPYTLHIHSIKSGLDLYHNTLFSALSAPIITSSQPQTLNVNTSVSSIDVSYNFVANQVVTWSITPTTYGDISSNGYLLLSFPRYTITSGSFVVSASNDNGTVSKTWSYNITNPPLITSSQPSNIIQNTSDNQYDISYNFTSNQDVSWSIVPITYGTIDASSGILTLSFPQYTIATGSITVAAINTQGIGTQTWSYNITNVPIITTSVPASITADTTDTSYNIMYDFDANQDVSWSIVPTTYGDINPNTGILNLSFPELTTDTGTFTLTATGIGGTAIQVWTYDVVGLIPDPISGGTYVDASGYRIRTFTSSSSMVVSTTTTIDYLIVAGGGGGGFDGAGGGGAGGILTGTLGVSIGQYIVTIGGGGAFATSVGTQAIKGTNSSLGTLIGEGGGGAGSKQSNGMAGGSGGGGGHPAGYSGGNGNAGPPRQGYNGGSSSAGGGGGGGGAGAIGTNATSTRGGNGGNGTQSDIQGTLTYYAGGGGGGNWSGDTLGGSGGLGGGGGGRGSNGIINGTSTDGTANTGGGGGGWGTGGGGNAGNGGSGIVIVRYSYTPLPPPTITSLQPENITADTTDNLYTISYTFTANKNVTWSISPITYTDLSSNILTLTFPQNTSASGTYIITATGSTGTATQSWNYLVQNSNALYSFTTNTFTNATATGRNGPTLAQIQSAYSSQSWASNTSYLNITVQGIQELTIPATGIYSFIVGGAAGGTATLGSVTANGTPGGAGRIISGNINLNMNDKLYIVIGQLGQNNICQGGGGGASFIYLNSLSFASLLFVAGGGGGATHTTTLYANSTASSTTTAFPGNDSGGSAGTSGGGGAGGSYNNGGGGSTGGSGGNGTGGNGGQAAPGSYFGGGGGGAGSSVNSSANFLGGNGGTGANTNGGIGGFGGGAGAGSGGGGGGGAGGGGGYNGGGGGGSRDGYGSAGGGGGTFVAGTVTNINTNVGTNTGNGYVTITK